MLPPPSSGLAEPLDFLSGGGEMGARARAHDWSATPLGPPALWPQSLRSALGICLNSSFPTAVYWGPDFLVLPNDAWAAITAGRPCPLGRPAREVWDDIWPVIGPQLAGVVETGAGFSAVDQMLTIRSEDLCETYWDYSFTPIRGENGAIWGVFNQGRETTERVLGERRREALSRRQRRLFEQAPGFITILIGPEHRFEFVNTAYARLFGDRSYLGRTAREAFPELEGQGVFERLDRVYQTGERFVASGMRLLLRGPDGATAARYLDFIYEAVTDETGAVSGIFCEGQDVTERHNAKTRLRESEERFRDIANAAPVLIWISDASGAVTWLNNAWLDFTGRPLEDERDDGWAANVHRDDFGRVLSTYQRAFERREPFRMDYRLRRRDGIFRVIDDSGAPRFDAAGRFLGYIGACVDVADARRAEQDLREINDTLELRVAARTAELERAQEALRQSQKLEAMGQLTGGVAHDFNNLLTPILGCLDMLQRNDCGDARAQRLISGALVSAERARTLVQRLLAFARRQPLQPTAVDVGALIAGAHGLVAGAVGPNVRIEISAEPRLPMALADAGQLEMALLNLAVNARDAMPDGGALTVTADLAEIGPRHRSRAAPGSYVRIAVADTGVGMSAATLARAVEPFFTTKGPGQGAGLGLSMAHGLASQLGGALAIDSSPGRGALVELFLPLAAGRVRCEPPAARREAPAPPKGSGAALLVDDEEIVRASTAEMLSDFGFSVVEAGSAESALRLLDEGLRPSVLVTDHLMPGMTGVALAREVSDRLPGTPVLIVSGYAEDEGVPSDLSRLAKPFRQADLAASVARVMAARGDA